MKTITLLLIATLTLAATTLQSGAVEKKKTPKQLEREKINEAREKQRDAVKDVLEEKDANKDGSITREEFIADETDKVKAGEKFDEANTNKDRSLSKGEIADMLGVGDDVERVKDEIRNSKKKKK